MGRECTTFRERFTRFQKARADWEISAQRNRCVLVHLRFSFNKFKSRVQHCIRWHNHYHCRLFLLKFSLLVRGFSLFLYFSPLHFNVINCWCILQFANECALEFFVAPMQFTCSGTNPIFARVFHFMFPDTSLCRSWLSVVFAAKQHTSKWMEKKDVFCLFLHLRKTFLYCVWACVCVCFFLSH